MICTTTKEVHNSLEEILESVEIIWIKVPVHNVPTLRFMQQLLFAIKLVKEYMLVGFL